MYKLSICVNACWISFVYTSRAEYDMLSKFKNSNAKFRLNITIFSTYISKCARKLFLCLCSFIHSCAPSWMNQVTQAHWVCHMGKYIACSRLSVSGDDRKSGRGTSGIWKNNNKKNRRGRPLLFFTFSDPARPHPSGNLQENENKNRRILPCGELLLPSLTRTRSFGKNSPLHPSFIL